MNSQLYTAASGLILEQTRLDLISNNLANASTSGFRAERLFAETFEHASNDMTERTRAANASVGVSGTYPVPGRGPLQFTGRDLDVALEDGTFFVVRAEGGTRYTRNGSLELREGGSLTDGRGNALLDTKDKPIKKLRPTAVVDADGVVRDNGNEVARLKLVRDPEGVLENFGNGLLSAAGKEARLENAKEPNLQPGRLEGSGTDALGELVNLIEAQRAFETYQKVITLTMNDVNRRAVNDLAG